MHAQLPTTASNTTSSIPAFAAEQSGVSPCTCKEGVGCGFIQYLLPTQQVTFRLFSDNSKLTRKFSATLTVGLLSPNWKLFLKTSLYIFLPLLLSSWKKDSNTTVECEKQTQASITHDLFITSSLTFQVGFRDLRDLLDKNLHMHFSVSFRSNSLAEAFKEELDLYLELPN